MPGSSCNGGLCCARRSAADAGSSRADVRRTLRAAVCRCQRAPYTRKSLPSQLPTCNQHCNAKGKRGRQEALKPRCASRTHLPRQQPDSIRSRGPAATHACIASAGSVVRDHTQRMQARHARQSGKKVAEDISKWLVALCMPHSQHSPDSAPDRQTSATIAAQARRAALTTGCQSPAAAGANATPLRCPCHAPPPSPPPHTC